MTTSHDNIETNQYLQPLQELFGTAASPRGSWNVDDAHTLLRLTDNLLEQDKPLAFSYVSSIASRLSGIARSMVIADWHECAYRVLYIMYDQALKQEMASNTRIPKGPILFDLAKFFDEDSGRSSTRHYASLAFAADVISGLGQRGAAYQLLLRFEPRHEIDSWYSSLRKQFPEGDGSLVFPEAALAARWFLEPRAKHILELRRNGDPDVHFVDLLLRAVSTPMESLNDAAKAQQYDRRGVLFEAAVGLLLSATPGFEVRAAFMEADEQVDLVVDYRHENNAGPLAEGYGLIECRASKDAIGAPELRDFAAKCQMHQVKFGILAALKGLTGSKRMGQSQEYQAAQLTRRKFFLQGLVLIVLEEHDLREARTRVDSLAAAIRRDYERVAFGERA